MYNNGFLICYDSPPINYVKLALSIDYLNDIANTLSLQKQANVILITDACHSGKLTEKKFKGNFLAGNQLRKFQGKEIRITSSSADQLSNEKEDWGGGRGVFSYYLVNGLKGLADKNKKGVVTVADIKNYLDSSLANDEVLKMENVFVHLYGKTHTKPGRKMGHYTVVAPSRDEAYELARIIFSALSQNQTERCLANSSS